MDFNTFVQEYGYLFGIFGALATILGLAFTVYKASHARHIRYLQERITDLEKPGTGGETKTLIHQLQQDLTKSEEHLETLKTQCHQWEKKYTTSHQEWQSMVTQKDDTCQKLTADLEHAKETAARLDRDTRFRANLVRKVFKLEGRLWQQKALHGIPKFRTLQDRRTAIVSLLNLKGGVGKTTLADAFDQKGVYP